MKSPLVIDGHASWCPSFPEAECGRRINASQRHTAA